MKHDESALVKEAMRYASERIAQGQRILPSAYMLVRRNPQTGAELTYPTAIGMAIDKPFEKSADYLEFLKTLRAEAKRLDAVAVALGGEAEAEIESGSTGKASRRRVFYLRVEDGEGIHHLHAAIERKGSTEKLGTLFDSEGAVDDLPEPLLPRASA